MLMDIEVIVKDGLTYVIFNVVINALVKLLLRWLINRSL